jgi:predicted amidophosphoribosyltransferase
VAGATLVAVPAHPSRARARGYDQAALLAAALARRTGAPLARPLRRGGPALRQLGASRAERLRRGRVAITATGAAPRRVVLVDDVHTTGATLDACARALRAAGCEHVTSVTWARALPR